MSGEEPYPDREEWPRYWQAIRTGAVWLATIVVLVGGAAFIPRPADAVPRVALEVAIDLTVVLVATALARWVERRWAGRGA